MTDAVALNSDQITTIGVGAIVGLVVLGFLASLVITAIVGRIVILVVVVGLGLLVWQQRGEIQDRVKKCQLDMTFVGVHIDAPADVQKQCEKAQTLSR